jgi:hypothetical protein
MDARWWLAAAELIDCDLQVTFVFDPRSDRTPTIAIGIHHCDHQKVFVGIGVGMS